MILLFVLYLVFKSEVDLPNLNLDIVDDASYNLVHV